MFLLDLPRLILTPHTQPSPLHRIAQCPNQYITTQPTHRNGTVPAPITMTHFPPSPYDLPARRSRDLCRQRMHQSQYTNTYTLHQPSNAAQHHTHPHSRGLRCEMKCTSAATLRECSVELPIAIDVHRTGIHHDMDLRVLLVADKLVVQVCVAFVFVSL